MYIPQRIDENDRLADYHGHSRPQMPIFRDQYQIGCNVHRNADYHGCQYLGEVKRDCLLILPLIEFPTFEADLDLNCIEEKGFGLIKEVEWIRIYHKQI